MVVFVGACVALVVGLPSALARSTKDAATPTVISVTAGKPTELAFKLSKVSVPAVGTVTFRVVNRGKLTHDFKVCTAPSTSSTKNACVGKVTAMLKPGTSAILAIKFTKKGSYEYLCTVPGHAGAGMKGLFSVATKVTPTPTPTTTTTTTTTTPTPGPPPPKPPATEPLIGDPADGASVFSSAGCGSCHTLAAAGSTGVIGPPLDGLANQLTQALIVQQVTNGGMTMPSFANSLTASQINDVAAYVYQSTHA
jgi:uncharacterized cupredoxin-like copper-binding protein